MFVETSACRSRGLLSCLSGRHGLGEEDLSILRVGGLLVDPGIDLLLLLQLEQLGVPTVAAHLFLKLLGS